MASPTPGNEKSVDIWSELIATDGQQHQQSTAVVYRRKNPHIDSVKQVSCCLKNRVSLVPGKRVSWNRSLFIRGRTSIAVPACVPKNDKKIGKQKPPLATKGKGEPPQNYDKERHYFKEVDAFELLEESPSPLKKTWVMGNEHCAPVSHISTILKKWLITANRNRSCGPSTTLSKILETPGLSTDSINGGVLDFSSLKTSSQASSKADTGVKSNNSKYICSTVGEKEDSQDIEFSIRNLSLSSRKSLLDTLPWDPLSALLAVCGQSSPSTFADVLSEYCDLQRFAKVGEGTYGEVFVAGEIVCKVVPFDGDSKVNGEIQKNAEELLEEVMLTLNLNKLRGNDNHQNHNVCHTFIHTLSLRVCEGPYDDAMIRSWDQWDEKHGSENDHPNEFSEKQRFVVFVQEHGGEDLEKFAFLSFNEARSLLFQVTLGLAVAEAAFEFEHRDLHWGNILLSRKGPETLEFILDGKKMNVKIYGLVVSIIDFTLSRINTGEDILFLDLSADPEIFEGPKGEIQYDTYRKMKDETEGFWEGSFPKTNVLWLQYLVDILRLKNSYGQTNKEKRDLRSLRKRLNGYDSAQESVVDDFFKDLIVSDV